jgi:hypothetical protein
MYISNYGVNTGPPEWRTLTPLIHVHLKSRGKHRSTIMNNTNPVILNVHVLVELVLSILEDLGLPRDFKCTYTCGVNVIHSGGPVFTPRF